MNWNDLRALLAAHRHGTSTAAGRALGVDPVTVVRRIEALERDLGVSLFQRTPRGLVPTDAADALLPLAEVMEGTAHAVERAAAGRQVEVAGDVRVACPADVAIRLIAPALPRLHDRHPGVLVHLITGGRVVDLHRQEADVSLRMVRPTHAELVCRRVGALPYAVYAHRDGCPQRWICLVEEASRLPEGQWLEKQRAGEPPALRVDRTAAMESAAAAGLGLALLPTPMGDENPHLVRVEPDAEYPLVRDLWLVVHRDLQKVPRIRVVMDFLVDLVGETVG